MNNQKENWLRNIILFLSSQTISLFGSSLVQYAMMWHITLTTESGFMMTLYIICGFIPTFILSPVAGVWADRYNRKMLIIMADALIAVATFILAILFLLGYHAIWLFFVMAAVRAFGSGIQMPAVGAILPQIVPQDKLTKVNGVNGSIQAITMFVSPMVSAALLGFTSIEVIFFIDVITAAIAIFTLLFFLKVSVHKKAAEKQKAGYFSDFIQGLRYVNYWRLSAIEIAFSVGMMAGGGIIASWGGFQNKVKTMSFASIIMGICTFALGIVPLFWIYLVFMAIFGIAMPIFSTPGTVLLQEKIEEEYLGRVFGVMGMISTSMMPFGMLIFGPIADFVKIEWLLLGTGIFIMILAISLGKNKDLIVAGEPTLKEP